MEDRAVARALLLETGPLAGESGSQVGVDRERAWLYGGWGTPDVGPRWFGESSSVGLAEGYRPVRPRLTAVQPLASPHAYL